MRRRKNSLSGSLVRGRRQSNVGGERRGARRSLKAGFTLIEVVVATGILMTIFAGGFGALVNGTKLIEIARDETRASQILQSEIEDLRTHDWATLTALASATTYAPQSSFTDAYSTRYTISRAIAPLSATKRRVWVVVGWTDNGGTAHTRDYKTIITKNGLYDYYYRSF